jgi:hypothetical protein
MTRTIAPQDISWFLDLHEREQLDLDPPHQRRSVWTLKDKRFFIDTILNNYPAPPIFLHKSLDDHGRATYHVVDGKQRLQTIIEFSNNKIRIPDNFSNISLQKKRWTDLPREVREVFWNYVLIVEMIPNIADASIRDTFERINRNSRKLERQEIRHAKYDGWLISAAEAEVDKDEWKEFGIVTTARAKRMSDVQFVSELFAVSLKKQLNGFDQDWLDELYAEYEEPEGLPLFIEDNFRQEFERTKEAIGRIIEFNPEIGAYTKILTHFYSLWGFLVLQTNTEFNERKFASAYREFMDEVANEIKRVSAEDEQADVREPVRIYAGNSRGASTDLTPRQTRHDALTRALSHLPGVIYEDR